MLNTVYLKKGKVKSKHDSILLTLFDLSSVAGVMDWDGRRCKDSCGIGGYVHGSSQQCHI